MTKTLFPLAAHETSPRSSGMSVVSDQLAPLFVETSTDLSVL